MYRGKQQIMLHHFEVQIYNYVLLFRIINSSRSDCAICIHSSHSIACHDSKPWGYM